MTAAHHTPGPWRIEVRKGDAKMISAGLNEYRDGPASYVGHIQGFSEADEAVLLSAPDLLAALEVVVADWTSQFERNGHMAPAWCRQARDAIAKARGA